MLHQAWLRRIIRWAQRSPAGWLYQHGPGATLSLPVNWPFFIISSAIIVVTYMQVPLLPLPHFLFSRIIQLLLFFALNLLLLEVILRLMRLDFRAIGLTPHNWAREALIGLGVSVPIILALMVNNSLAGSPPRLDWVRDSLDQQRALWILELAVKAVVVAILEEVIYRGWITTFLLTRLKNREFAIWISAVIFGLLHLAQGLKGIAITTVFGYCYGLLYIWRKNLVVAIVVHTMNNFCIWLGLLGGPWP